MKLHNPTTNEITIKHNGVEFSLQAGETKELPDDTANFWLGLHGFLKVSNEDASEKSAPEAEPVKEEEPKASELSEPEEVTKPKRGRKSNKQSK